MIVDGPPLLFCPACGKKLLIVQECLAYGVPMEYYGLCENKKCPVKETVHTFTKEALIKILQE